MHAHTIQTRPKVQLDRENARYIVDSRRLYSCSVKNMWQPTKDANITEIHRVQPSTATG